jgi:transcription factor C subunit 3
VTRSFYEKVWDWVTEQPDIRIFHQQTTLNLSLSEFEALEAGANVNNPNAVPSRQPWQPLPCAQAATTPLASLPSDDLLSLGGVLRERLLGDGCTPTNTLAPQAVSDDANLLSSRIAQPHPSSPATATLPMPATTNTELDIASADIASPPEVARVQSRLRGPRKIPKGFRVQEPIFDEPPSSLTAPKLFASQNRIWQAVAGHSLDLKKLPAMEFVLLCIIATYGSEGIAQPELVVLSGQDKRSVPKRTDALAQKGYIEKIAHYSNKIHTHTHTSLCIHKKSAKGNRGAITERTIDEVFGQESNFDGAGFIYLLHKLLVESGGAVPVRELRRRMVKIPYIRSESHTESARVFPSINGLSDLPAAVSIV